MAPIQVSLFRLLTQQLGAQTPVSRFSKATLVHISHTLEDIVLKHRLPALLFTGFQESSHWREETARYIALAEVAQQVCIFAGQPLPDDSLASVLQITLAGDDPLRQEWFLLILSERFSALLCGQDQLAPAATEAERQFDTLWTFDPAVIHQVLDLLEKVIAQYRPDKLDTLRSARQQTRYTGPEYRLVEEFTRNTLVFQEALHRKLREQDALRAELEQQREMNRLRYEFMTMVSHEFRTPLTAILSNAEIMQRYADRLDAARQRERLQSISNMVQFMRAVLDDMTLVLNGEEGLIRYDPYPVKLDTLLTGIIADVVSVQQAQRHVTYSLTPPPDPQRPVRHTLDPRLLRHILSNLLSNALKYSPADSTVDVEALVTPGQLLLRVRDQGIGINPNDIPRLFEPFYRGLNVSNVPGSGLGLKIVADAVRLHNGQIEVESRLGTGSTFTVTLPLKTEGAEA